jgi:hypothetical protein
VNDTPPQEPPDVPRMLTQQQTAERLGLGLSTLHRFRGVTADGRECYEICGQVLPIIRLGRHYIRVSSVAVDRAIVALADAS